jgi:predicted RNase H-like HicB family nuclease
MNHVIAFIHEENNVFGISFPDFAGCISTADTIDNAILRGQQALALHILGMIEDGETLPVLRSLTRIQACPLLKNELKNAVIVAIPMDFPSKAVRVNITIEERLLERVDRAAKASGTSRSSYLAEAARARIGA